MSSNPNKYITITPLEDGEIKGKCPRGTNCAFKSHYCLFRHPLQLTSFYSSECRYGNACPGINKICSLKHDELSIIPYTSSSKNFINDRTGWFSSKIVIPPLPQPPYGYLPPRDFVPPPRDFVPPPPRDFVPPPPRDFVPLPPRDFVPHYNRSSVLPRNNDFTQMSHREFKVQPPRDYVRDSLNRGRSRSRSVSRGPRHNSRSHSVSRDRRRRSRSRSVSRSRRSRSRSRSVSRERRKSRNHNHRHSRSRSRSNRHHNSQPNERRYKSRSRSPKPTQRKIVIDRKTVIPYVNDKISICCHGPKCRYFKMKICHFMHPSQIDTCFNIYEDTGNIMLAINKAKEFKDFALNNRDKNPNFKKYFRV